MRAALKSAFIGGVPTTISRLRRLASAARDNNPHTLPVMSQAPSVTAYGTTFPSWANVSGYTYSAHPEVWRIFGGTPIDAGGERRVRAATIAPTGGNLGTGDGAQAVTFRLEAVINAEKVAFRVGPTVAKYRFIVNGRYVDRTGTRTIATSGTVDEYIVLDFTRAGGKASRTIALEGQLTGAFEGAYVATGDTITLTPATDLLRGILVGDSYAASTGATAAGDGYGAIMMDCLGIRDQWLSGSGGTGWATSNSSYAFGERPSDWLDFSPDVLFFQGSYNDRANSTSDITTNCLAALTTTRAALPNIPIFVLGAFAGATGPSSGIIDAENAVKSAVSQMPSRFIRFIPVSTDTPPWVSGTGYITSPTGSGNSDIYTSSDQVHPGDAGHEHLGLLAADGVISALRTWH